MNTIQPDGSKKYLYRFELCAWYTAQSGEWVQWDEHPDTIPEILEPVRRELYTGKLVHDRAGGLWGVVYERASGEQNEHQH